MAGTKELNAVHEFWNIEACGTHLFQDVTNKAEFYEKYRDFRYRNAKYILETIPFSELKGKNVLEIGCGNGADATMFAGNGANYTGCDLTQAAVDATREHFETLGLTGHFQVENAESLSFADNTFDLVYSYGVLHHSPHPPQAIREAYRVLKPNGKAIIMLYHKHSLIYYLLIMGYMRLRVLMKIFSRLGWWDSDRELLASMPLLRLPNASRQVWDIHYKNFLDTGWSYLKPATFVHRATDGPECPYAFVYTKSDVKKMFSMFSQIELTVPPFLPGRYRFAQWIPGWVERFIGWHLLIFATK